MIYMGTEGGGGWAERGRRIAASPHAPALAGPLLALAAMTEAIARGAGSGRGVASLVGVAALALFTTVPLALLGPVAASLAICAPNLLSPAAFHTLPAAGPALQLTGSYPL